MITVAEGRLASALRELAVKRGVGILFSPEAVGGLLSSRVTGRLSNEEALSRLLAGSGLSYRRTAPDTFVVYQPPPSEAPPVVSEILIVGRKALNADIPRTENDIQPYQVLGARDIASFRADQVGQLVRDRFTFDAHGATADPLGNRSSFNIRGLSTDETLVLVDGMRMPGIPQGADVSRTGQPDLNAIPLMAIERVEALTATSGGIYGPGALGGVVNVVLKRDYRGAEIGAGVSVTGAGGGVRRRLDARLGFTPDHGRTDIMLVASRVTSERLRVGQRDYDQKSRRMQLETGADPYAPVVPLSEGVFIRSYGGALTLKPSLGGANLGMNSLLLPLGYGDLRTQGGAAWFAKAVSSDEALVMANPHDQTSLMPSFETISAIASLRRDFGRGVEGFADLVYLQNNSSRYQSGRLAAQIEAADPLNIFQQAVEVSFPVPGLGITYQDKLRSYRLTAGVIAPLAKEWRGEASYSWGGVQAFDSKVMSTFSAEAIYAMYYTLREIFLPKDFSKPIPNIFGGWSQFVADINTYRAVDIVEHSYHQWFQAANVRLGGPLVRTRAGPISLTMSGEWRREAVGTSEHAHILPAYSTRYFSSPYIQGAASLYGEIRAPVAARDSGLGPLRGLELQLAGRYDHYMAKLPNGYQDSEMEAAHRKTLSTVAGARAFPLEHVMVRASVATGSLPPPPEYLAPSWTIAPLREVLPFGDPRRGGEKSSDRAKIWIGGSSNVKSEWARTVSFGLVLNPEGGDRPRVSLDYTHINKRDELTDAYAGAYDYFVRKEDLYPDRVKRAPLTAEDIAAGYTGGVLTEIDASPLNRARAVIETVDLKIDYRRPVGRAAMLRLYSSATWTGHFVRAEAPEDEDLSLVGNKEGPLAWRAQGGVDLDHGPWTISLNGQFYGPYHDLTVLGLSTGGKRTPVRKVRSQFYLDLNAAYRVERIRTNALQGLELRVGIANLLDEPGPTTLHDYSPFSDPRGRRLDATLSARF